MASKRKGKSGAYLDAFRLRMLARGGYAASRIDAAAHSSTLIEGDGRRSGHVVMVQGKRWIEIAHTPLIVRGGVCTSTLVLTSARAHHLERTWIRTFPNGTRRVDICKRVGRQTSNTSHWKFPDGKIAEAVRRPGRQEVVFKNAAGRVYRKWAMVLEAWGGGTRVVTKMVDAHGSLLGSVTSICAGATTRREATAPDGSTTSSSTKLSDSAGGKISSVTWTREGGWGGQIVYDTIFGKATMTTEYDNDGRSTGVTEVDDYVDLRDGTIIKGVGVQSVDENGTTSQYTWTEAGDGEPMHFTETEVNGHVTDQSVTTASPDGGTDTSAFTLNEDGSVTLTNTHVDAKGKVTTTTETFKLRPSQGKGGTKNPFARDEDDEDDDDSEGDDDDDGNDDDGDDDDGDDGVEDDPAEGDGDDHDGGTPSDDGTDEGPPDILALAARHAGEGLGSTPTRGGDDTGDHGEVDDHIDLIGKLLSDYAGKGGQGPPSGGNGDSGWGDSSSGESPGEIDFDRVVAGKPVHSADDTGWGDLVNPRALVASASSVLGRSRLKAVIAALDSARATAAKARA